MTKQKQKEWCANEMSSGSNRSDLQLLIASVEKLSAAGVRVLEVGEGASRVRLEIDPVAGLMRSPRHGSVRGSAPGRAVDPERADDNEAASPEAEAEDAEQAENELDLAHLP